jgi:hypothetical protein
LPERVGHFGDGRQFGRPCVPVYSEDVILVT